MQIAIIGTGYVGLVTGACLAHLGHEVICHDIDQQKIDNLKKGIIPIYEPGLEEIVKENYKAERLKFTTDFKEAVQYAAVVMSAVGTPPDKDHKADLQYVKEVAANFAAHLNGYQVFVNKSTVPVGTAEICRSIIQETVDSKGINAEFDVVSNPEFLREGQAVNDTLNPDRIVVGVENDKARGVMNKLYEPYIAQDKNIIFTDIKSAEIIKYASNAFLATKISFINEIAEFCDKAGGDIRQVAAAVGMDHRVSPHFLRAGIGYGGSCFPKDVKALIQSGKEFKSDFSLIQGVDDRNQKQPQILIEKFRNHYKKTKGLKVALLGLAFKPETDDIRCAASTKIIQGLLKLKADIHAYDPHATENFATQHPELAAKITLADSLDAALTDADCIFLVTEWPEFTSELNLDEAASKMKGNVIFDGRIAFTKEQIQNSSFQYEAIGIPSNAGQL